jgi:hypothetical protein
MDKHDKDMLYLAVKYWVLVIFVALITQPMLLFYIVGWLIVLASFLFLNFCNKDKKMSNYKTTTKKEASGHTTITNPSSYGSHASMVVSELDNGMVLCKDDTHEYETFKNRLDTGLADPRRYS